MRIWTTILSITLVLFPTVVLADVTAALVRNSDKTAVRIFYSGGKEIARQTLDKKENVTKTTGKIPDGIVKEFNDNGKLLFEWNYKNGKLNGVSKNYFLSGELLEDIIYKDNKREGVSKKYFISGKLLTERYFESGELEGMTKVYAGDGKVVAELNYKKGKLDGETKIYYKNGKLRTVESYENNQKIRVKSYDPKGKVLVDHDYTSNKIVTTTTTVKRLKDTNTNKSHK